LFDAPPSRLNKGPGADFDNGANFHSDKAKFLLRLNGTLSLGSRRNRIVILLGNVGNSLCARMTFLLMLGKSRR
jgi:hypothetical protein